MHDNPQLKKAYGTPVIANIRGRDVVISPAANWVYGYAPATGKELWKVEYGSLGFSIVPKPVIGKGMIYIGTSYMHVTGANVDHTLANHRLGHDRKSQRSVFHLPKFLARRRSVAINPVSSRRNHHITPSNIGDHRCPVCFF